MSKEIEEMRSLKAKQKELQEFLETITDQLKAKGFFYVMSIVDPESSNVMSAIECRSGFLPSMLTDLTNRITNSLVAESRALRAAAAKPPKEEWEH